MKTPLSQDEMQTLDRQISTLNYQLTEIAALLETRFGKSHEMAQSARMVQLGCERLTGFLHELAPRDNYLRDGIRAAS